MLRSFLSSPRTIGAIIPSSAALANAMARQIEHGASVIEIGAGTGAITRHITRIGHTSQLVIFEQDRRLAELLRHQLVQVRVIEGLFHNMVGSLGDLPDNLVMVSSVPFKSLSGKLHFETAAAICRILCVSPNRRLIQYSYFDSHPFVPHHSGLQWRRLSRVWANLPPATIWELRAEHSLGTSPS
ncbi:MAG: hypothetical protein OEL20_18365 [Sulfuritalea sp.]|nr:hypothetical protein [Sulfuritalea sp.]